MEKRDHQRHSLHRIARMVWEAKHGQGKARTDWMLNRAFGLSARVKTLGKTIARRALEDAQ